MPRSKEQNAQYMKQYRKANPDKIQLWRLKGAMKKLEQWNSDLIPQAIAFMREFIERQQGRG